MSRRALAALLWLFAVSGGASIAEGQDEKVKIRKTGEPTEKAEAIVLTQVEDIPDDGPTEIDESSLDVSSAESSAQINLGGYVEGRWALSTAKKEGDNELADDRARLQLLLNRQLSGHSGVYASFGVFYDGLAKYKSRQHDLNDEAQRAYDRIYDTNRESFFAELKEGYVDLYLGKVDLRLGRQVIKWGAVDNPSSQLNPNAMVSPPNARYSFLNAIEDALIGVNGVKANVYAGPIELEIVGVPVYQNSKVPDPSSFWGVSVDNEVPIPGSQISLEGKVDGAGPSDIIDVVPTTLPVPTQQITINDQLPGPSMRDMSGGARLKWTVFDQDMSIMYYHGHEFVPTVVPRAVVRGILDTSADTFTPQSIRRVEVKLKYPEYDGAGFSMAGEIGLIDIGYRLDANYVFQREFSLDEQTAERADEVDVPNLASGDYNGEWDVTVRQKTIFLDQASVGVGIDHKLPLHNMHIFLDYFGRRVLDAPDILLAETAQDFASLRIQDHFFRERLYIRTTGLIDLNNPHWYVKPEIEFRVTDNDQILLGGLFIIGPSAEVASGKDLNLGPFVDKDVVYLVAKHSF